MSGRIHVHIDAVTLRGFTAGQRDQLVAGLRAELTHVLTTGRTPLVSRSVAEVNGGRIALARDASAWSVGSAAARRVAGSFGA